MPGHGSRPRTVMSALWRPPLILCPSSADLTASEKSSDATTESSPVPSSGTTVAQGCSLSTVSGDTSPAAELLPGEVAHSPAAPPRHRRQQQPPLRWAGCAQPGTRMTVRPASTSRRHRRLWPLPRWRGWMLAIRALIASSRGPGGRGPSAFAPRSRRPEVSSIKQIYEDVPGPPQAV